MRLLAALTLVVGLLWPPSGSTAEARERVDTRIGATDCRLLGRVYVGTRGCSRQRCLPPARMFKKDPGAEACALRRQGEYFYGAAVDFRRCRALGRRWIAPVNWCASNPDRDIALIHDAPQCTGRSVVYLTHTEREGRYDECVTPARLRALRRLAAASGRSLEHEAWERSAVLCADRARHVYDEGRCVPGDPHLAPGGTVLVGDSIAWRGTDELARRRPDLIVDGIPSRRLDALEPRLDRFRLEHGQPDGLILELGTNPSPGFTGADLRRVVRTLPGVTTVMLVLPHRAHRRTPTRGVRSSALAGRWMRGLAARRPHTCLADWPAVVARRPDLLVDGVHPTRVGEGFWARWIAKSWQACQRHGSL